MDKREGTPHTPKRKILLMYMPGDVVLTRGTARLSKLIRRLTQDKGESETLVNHAGIMVDKEHIVEALLTVKHRELRKAYATKTGQQVAIFRPVTISPTARETVADHARDFVGRKYGPLKLLLHLGDWCLGGKYFFRRIGKLDKYPICSYLVAACYKKIGLDFGVPVSFASPDDIWDFVTTSKHYKCVKELGPM